MPRAGDAGLPTKVFEATPGLREARGTKDSFSVDLVKPHKNQAKILRSKAKYRVCCTSRRFGKTELAKISVTLRAFSRSSNIWYCSPTYQNSERVFREFIRLFENLPQEIININRTNMRIEIKMGEIFSLIEFKSLKDPDNLRGAGLDYVVIDEGAYVDDGVWDTVIQPMLLSTEGEALIISTPASRNWFYVLYQLGSDPDYEEYESFHFTVYDNPLLKPKSIEAIKRRLPLHIWEQEYMANFMDDGGQVFQGLYKAVRDWQEISGRGHSFRDQKIDQGDGTFVIEKVATDLMWWETLGSEEAYVEAFREKAKSGSCTIVFGVDIGRLEDYTVVTVFDLDSQSIITYERISQVLWEEIEDLIGEMYEEWNPIAVLIESNNATGLIESLEKQGYPVIGLRTTSKTKPEMIQKLSIAIEHGDLSIPNDKKLLDEFKAFQMKISPSGNIKYSAPSGLHDDIVMSVAVAFIANEDVVTDYELEIISV